MMLGNHRQRTDMVYEANQPRKAEPLSAIEQIRENAAHARGETAQPTFHQAPGG